MVWRYFILLLVLLPTTSRASAGDEPLLAVLDFDSPDDSASLDGRQLLTDAFRSVVIETVGERFKVLTRETMTELIPPSGAECFLNKCAAEIGRMLQASHVIAGSVRRLEGQWVLTVEAYLTNGGRALGTKQLIAAGQLKLIEQIEKQGGTLVRSWLKLDPVAAPVAAPAPVRPTPREVQPPVASPPPLRVMRVERAEEAAPLDEEPPVRVVRVERAAPRIDDRAVPAVPVVREERDEREERATPVPVAPPERPREPTAAPRCLRGMVLITGGTFEMGSDAGDADERPVHRVSLSTFCLDRTEAVDDTGLPVVNVTWQQAQTACQRRGGRLPTEAEWEFAARGTAGRPYPWGRAEPTRKLAVYCELRPWNYEQCKSDFAPLVPGSAPAGVSAAGVQDLAGNVWEWVQDCYEVSYPADPARDPRVSTPGCTRHGLRGGSYLNAPPDIRAANRFFGDLSYRRGSIGYRCAADPVR